MKWEWLGNWISGYKNNKLVIEGYVDRYTDKWAVVCWLNNRASKVKKITTGDELLKENLSYTYNSLLHENLKFETEDEAKRFLEFACLFCVAEVA